jgi:hypothetical protein
MTDGQTVWLAVIAVAILTIAVVQVAVALQLAKTAREVTRTAEELRQGLRPLLDKVNRIADDAARGTALAVAQIERVDQFLGVATARVDETLTAVRQAVVEPLRQGSVIVAAIKAIVSAFRRPARREVDEEDPLFVG